VLRGEREEGAKGGKGGGGERGEAQAAKEGRTPNRRSSLLAGGWRRGLTCISFGARVSHLSRPYLRWRSGARPLLSPRTSQRLRTTIVYRDQKCSAFYLHSVQVSTIFLNGRTRSILSGRLGNVESISSEFCVTFWRWPPPRGSFLVNPSPTLPCRLAPLHDCRLSIGRAATCRTGLFRVAASPRKLRACFPS